MKKAIFIFLSITLFILIGPINSTFAGKVLYDDFSGKFIDSNKWGQREFVREIVDGKLVIKLSSSEEARHPTISHIFLSSFLFADPDSIHTFEAEITIVETETGVSGSFSGQRIGGCFYNSNDINTGDPTGDIEAQIWMGDFGDEAGLEARWRMLRVINNSGEYEILGEGTLLGPGQIEYNKPVLTKISYDGSQLITFSVYNVSTSFEGPERKRPGFRRNIKGFSTIIMTGNDQENAFIHAKLDNVRINNEVSLYDDFSDTLINASKWRALERVREIKDGCLRISVRGRGSTQTVDTPLTERDASYIEAKVMSEDGTRGSSGAHLQARIQGYYYNDIRGPGSGQDYNQHEGDIFVHIGLAGGYHGSEAAAYVYRSSKPDQSEFILLFKHVFSVPVIDDKYYVLSIKFEGNKLIFGCEGETAEYNITTPIYKAYGEHRLLRSRISLTPGEGAYLKIRFDDVYISDKGKTVPGVLMLLLDDE